MGLQYFDGLTVRKAATGEVAMAVFTESLPTQEEMARVSRHGMRVHIAGIPPQQRDADMRGLLRGVSHLGVVSTVEDLEWVAEMVELEVLSLYCSPSKQVDLRKLTKLRRFDGFLRNLESILQLPSLLRLSLQEVRDGGFEQVSAPVSECELVDLQNLSVLPHFSR